MFRSKIGGELGGDRDGQVCVRGEGSRGERVCSRGCCGVLQVERVCVC